MKTCLPVLCCAALLLAAADRAPAAVQIVPIDGFDSSPMAIDLSGSTGSQTVTNATFDNSILGGYRTLFLSVTKPGSTAKLLAGAIGELLLDTGPGVIVDASVTWDSATNGLGGVDLTGGGRANSFLLEVNEVDHHLQLDLRITDSLGNTASFGRSGLTAGAVVYSFSGYTGVNLASVDSIVLAFSGPAGVDASINLLGTYYIPPQGTVAIPEPSSLLTFGLLCLSACCWTRRAHLRQARRKPLGCAAAGESARI